MKLSKLNIHQLRNIQNISIVNLSERFNIFYGNNGSGKTSLLEAIYILFNGHSFRTREIQPLITYERDKLIISGALDTQDLIAIQKSTAQASFAKFNHEACKSSSQLAKIVPVQIFHQDIFQIIDSSPTVRRGVLDWGLFHVEQQFHELWKNYKHVLKQRNALLKTSRNYKAFIPWDIKLAQYAHEIDIMRNRYFERWKDEFMNVLGALSSLECTIEYYNGWSDSANENLLTLLEKEFYIDLSRQYTRLGAHCADIKINIPQNKAKRVLSRGQQKIILYALKLSQAQLLDRECLYLFDDLHAELDSKHVSNVLRYIESMTGQFFITAIEPYPVFHELNAVNWYQVDDGVIVPRETNELCC